MKNSEINETLFKSPRIVFIINWLLVHSFYWNLLSSSTQFLATTSYLSLAPPQTSTQPICFFWNQRQFKRS